MPRLLVVAAALLFLALSPARALAGPSQAFSELGGDFSAFYCSGAAVAARRDPYLVEPLRACEERVQPSASRTPGVVTPSPLPAYDLAMFAAFAQLPYTMAKLLWYAVLLSSIGVAAFCLTRLTGFPPLLTLLVIAPVDGLLNLSFGQVPPIVVAALCLAAYYVERSRYVPAALAVAFTMIEPHIGAPACIAMFLFLPRARSTLGASAALLTGIAYFTGGLTQNVAYFTTHLPAQARGELVAADQFGLSPALHLLHVPDRSALLLGTLSYLVMAVLGIWLGRYAARALKMQAFIVVVPAAAVLFAGTYVHDVQFAAALPAAMLFCAKEPRRAAPWIVLGLLLVPWFTYVTGGHSLGLGIRILCAATLVWLAAYATRGRLRSRRPLAVSGALGGFALILTLCTLAPHAVTGEPGPVPAAFLLPTASAQENWGAYLRVTPSLNKTTLRQEVEKLPLWLGVLGILFLAADVPLAALSESPERTGRRNAAERIARDDLPSRASS